MKLIIISAIVLCISIWCDVQEVTSNLSSRFQKICNEMLPTHTTENGTLNSLVCGEKVTGTEYEKTLQRTGLIHVFVVSGSHLVIVSELMAKLRCHKLIRFLILGLFTFLTGFQPPCLRSLVQFFLAEKSCGLNLKSDQRVLLSGIMLLAVFPNLVSSLSLQLSWIAAMALALTEEIFCKSGRLKKLIWGSVIVYIFIFPVLSLITSPHPLSILWNILFAPFLTLWIFPLSAFAIVNEVALFILEKVMPWLWRILSFAEQFTVDFKLLNWDLVLTWAWLLSLQGVIHLALVMQRRRTVT